MLKVAKKDIAKLPHGGSVMINFDGKAIIRKDGHEILLRESDLEKIMMTFYKFKARK